MMDIFFQYQHLVPRASLGILFQWRTSCSVHRKKKVREFPVPSRDVTTKLSLGGNNDVIIELLLPRGSLVSDIQAGDGKLVNLFLRCSQADLVSNRGTSCSRWRLSFSKRCYSRLWPCYSMYDSRSLLHKTAMLYDWAWKCPIFPIFCPTFSISFPHLFAQRPPTASDSKSAFTWRTLKEIPYPHNDANAKETMWRSAKSKLLYSKEIVGKKSYL